MQPLTDKVFTIRELLDQKVIFRSLGLVLLVVVGIASGQMAYRYEAAHPARYATRAGLTSEILTQNSKGVLEVEIFGKNKAITFQKPSLSFFGGGLDSVKAHGPVSYTNKFVVIFVLSLCTLFFRGTRLNSLFCLGVLTFISVTSVWLSFRLSIGQDEFFTNLKHAQSWLEAGRFSLNRLSRTEGTVDFLPYFLAGLCGNLGLPLAESLFCILLTGNIALIFLTYFWTKRVTHAADFGLLMAAFIGLFPNVLYMGLTGFTSVLFTAVILGGIYLYHYVPTKKTLGLVFLGLLTLFRTEGALAAGLIWGCGFLVEAKQTWPMRPGVETLKRFFVEGLIVVGPFVVSCIVRRLYFGFWVPLPIPFKATGGDIHYLVKGLDQLRGVISQTNFDRLALIALLPIVIGSVHFLKGQRVLLTLLVLTFFSLIYFSAGGDWLPPYTWNRYTMPFTVYFYLMAGLGFFLLSHNLWGAYHRFLLYPFLIVVFALWYRPDSALARITMVPPRPTTFTATPGAIEEMGVNYWARIDRLAALGQLLKLTTPDQTVIASPEVSTIMYFANRDVLDILGVANPDIAFSKLDPLNYDLSERKRNPQTIERHRPGIIAICEPVDEAKTDFNAQTLSMATMLLKNGHFKGTDPNDIAYYRVGSFKYLKNLGYRHVAILLPEIYFNYFVSAQLYHEHVTRLKTLGFNAIGKTEVAYQYSQAVVSHFSEDGR